MKLQPKRYPVPVSQELLDIVDKEINRTGITGENGICIVFQRSTTLPEKASFLLPVEMSISSKGRIIYISVFSIDADSLNLVREMDFDIRRRIFRSGEECYPIEKGREIFNIWQERFCFKYSMNIYDGVLLTEGIRQRRLSAHKKPCSIIEPA